MPTANLRRRARSVVQLAAAVIALLGLAFAPTAQRVDTIQGGDTACNKPYAGPLTLRFKNARQTDYEWNDEYVEQPVTMTSARTCATLYGVLYGPTDLAQHGELPSVLVIPPSGGIATNEQVAYIARALAENGYVALTVDPQGTGSSDVASWLPCGTEPGYSHPSPCPGQPFQSMDNWMEAGRTGLDFLLSGQNPWADHVDTASVGATGHSLGARAASYLQDPRFDLGDDHSKPRIHAVVGLDNLSANYYGDRSADANNGFINDGHELQPNNRIVNGQPLGGDVPITITAPGLGLGSDDDYGSPDDKKEAALAHRDQGQPSGMLILDGVEHGQFSQFASSEETPLVWIAHYTVAWFDLWLRGGANDALERLLTRDIDGTPVADILSDTERSAWYLLDGMPHCEDWQLGCPTGKCSRAGSETARGRCGGPSGRAHGGEQPRHMESDLAYGLTGSRGVAHDNVNDLSADDGIERIYRDREHDAPHPTPVPHHRHGTLDELDLRLADTDREADALARGLPASAAWASTTCPKDFCLHSWMT